MVVLSEIQEEASSSSSAHGHRYDVFISSRGLDTRNSFTAYLYKALLDANITAFLDDEEFEIGKDLKPELESAIKASRASVIVLSKNYAASTWCLDELVLILEQRKTSNQIVIPIFYHVEPTHVRWQESSFGDAMSKHRRMMEAEKNSNKRSKWAEKIDRWNKSLIEVANLKGMDLNGSFRKEKDFIEEIVEDIYGRLHISLRSHLPQLFGMDNSITFVTSWLKDIPTHTIDVLTILGMGGIGKTSLAKYMYGLYSHEFNTSSFLEDISRRCENIDGLLNLQKELYYDITKKSPINIRDASVYTSMIENALAYKKVFLVLDDIDSLDQLNVLLGSRGLHKGSKIMITTRNAWLTESCELFKMNVKPEYAKHELEGLYNTDSHKLLCFHAFMCNDPKEGYEEVSIKLVKYCQGHPMALQILGKVLHNQDVAYWEDYLERLKKENGSPINNVLKLSFDSLPFENDKHLFKHIACFFVGMDTGVTETILKACDIDTRSGITHLIEKCLLSITGSNEFMMHQLVREMGRFLVRDESLYKPWERTRLWCDEESFNVLKQTKGTENLLGLTLDMRMLEQEKLHGSLDLKTNALIKMDNLMLLQLNYVHLTGSFKHFPKELRWLCMHGFPLKSIPSDLPMENLVALDMSYSNIESFGSFYSYPQRLHKRLKQLIESCSKDKRLLGSLKILNLSFCEQLRSLDGFDHLPKLEKLILRGCISLLEVYDSIEQCGELVLIDLSNCNKIEKLPKSLGMLKKVKTLLLKGCNLGLPQIDTTDVESTKKLKTNKIGINTITSFFPVAIPRDLKFFMVSLPRSIVSLSLENNNLSTESFPMDFTCLSMLKELYLDDNPIVSLPDCVRSLPMLETLSMVDCNMLVSIEHPPHTLTSMVLYINIDKPLLRRVVFDPQMSPLVFIIDWRMLAPSSIEFEGLVKIEPLEGVEGNILRSLGWTKLDFPIGKRMVTCYNDKREEFEIQMYYEFGIFSTIYGGKEMPNWIMERSTGPSISITVPSSPNKLKGLNFCCVLTSRDLDETLGFEDDDYISLPVIIMSNITKNLTWIYEHYIDSALDGDGKFLTLLSHWMVGMNEMECGDHITINLRENPDDTCNTVTTECGVNFVFDDGNTNEEEDVLGYYRSWNHIIGGDLIGFQTTTGEYILSNRRIVYSGLNLDELRYDYLCDEGARFKDELVHFRAFSERKSGILEDGPSAAGSKG